MCERGSTRLCLMPYRFLRLENLGLLDGLLQGSWSWVQMFLIDGIVNWNLKLMIGLIVWKLMLLRTGMKKTWRLIIDYWLLIIEIIDKYIDTAVDWSWIDYWLNFSSIDYFAECWNWVIVVLKIKLIFWFFLIYKRSLTFFANWDFYKNILYYNN